MIRFARDVLLAVRTFAALAGVGFVLIESLRLIGPANVPDVGPYTFLALAIAALAVWIAARGTDAFLARLDLAPLDRRTGFDRRAIELGAAARPKVVDLTLYRRLAGRGHRRHWSWSGSSRQ